LGISNTVSVDDEVGGEFASVLLSEGLDRFLDDRLHLILNDFLAFPLDQVV